MAQEKAPATIKSLREILLNTEPPKLLVDRKTEMPMYRQDLMERALKMTTREEALEIEAEIKLVQVIKKLHVSG